MPCSYYLPGEREAIDRAEAEAKLKECKDQLDRATALLCDISNIPEVASIVRSRLPAFSGWESAHRRMDEERLAAEDAKKRKEDQANLKLVEPLVKRQQALKKLSSDEAKALGVRKLTPEELKLIKKYKHLLPKKV